MHALSSMVSAFDGASLVDWCLDALWTNAALAALAAAVTAAIAWKIRRAEIRHALWLFVLLQLLSPPLLRWAILPSEPTLGTRILQVATVSSDVGEPVVAGLVSREGAIPDPGASVPPTSQTATTATSRTATTARTATATTTATAQGTVTVPGTVTATTAWRDRLAALALLGAMTLFSLALLRGWRLESKVRAGRPADSALKRRTSDLARAIGLDRIPRIVVVEECLPPMIWAPWPTRPRLLLPEALLRRLDGDETDALLLHELTHVARRDHWVRFVETLATVLFWWHPVLWLARRALRADEERACDARTLAARPDLSSAYARGLITTLDFLRGGGAGQPVLATASDPRHDIEERLTMILRARPSSPESASAGDGRRGRNLRRGLVGLAAVALLVVPVRAGDEDEADRRALRERMEHLEAQSQAIREQQKALELQVRELEDARRALRHEADRIKIEAQASELEASHRTGEAALLREKAEMIERERALESERALVERQAKIDIEQLETEISEQREAAERWHGRDRARAEELAARAEALAVERRERMEEARDRIHDLESAHHERLREHFDRAEAIARSEAATEHHARILEGREKLERRIASRMEARESERRAIALEMEARDRKRQFERLRRAGEHEAARELRRRSETELALRRARREVEHALRQREEIDRSLVSRLQGLEGKLETLRERTTSATEAEELDRQLDAIRGEIEKLRLDG